MDDPTAVVTFEVVHTRVAVRCEPNTNSKPLGVLKQGDIIKGWHLLVGGVPWVRLSDDTIADYMLVVKEQGGAWALSCMELLSAWENYYGSRAKLTNKLLLAKRSSVSGTIHSKHISASLSLNTKKNQ